MRRKKGRPQVRENIIPGKTIVRVISALAGGVAEKIVLAIADSERGSKLENRREFEDWRREGDIQICKGYVWFGNRNFSVHLKVGCAEGLFLRDVPGAKLSLRDVRLDQTVALPLVEFVLEAGEGLDPDRIFDCANNIVGTWVIHGKNWINRVDDIVEFPFGEIRNLVTHLDFTVVDGGVDHITLGNLVERGGIRSAHVGEWTRSATIVAAVSGVPVLLHEFREGSRDIRSFRDVVISDGARNRWGGYCDWNLEGREAVARDPFFGHLARRAASPFSFHVHATRKRFPNCELVSSYLLRNLGEGKLREILEVIVAAEPERVYRLIDETGITHRLVGVTQSELLFGNRESPITFLRREAANNIVSTCIEFSRMHENPERNLSRVRRLVLDSHFYVVLPSLVQANSATVNGSVYHLSGSGMHDYLFRGQNSAMHRIRNDRLFKLLKSFFGRDTLVLRVCPPIPTSVVNCLSQYSPEHEQMSSDRWHSLVLT